jgi:hypothetical protein
LTISTWTLDDGDTALESMILPKIDAGSVNENRNKLVKINAMKKNKRFGNKKVPALAKLDI